VLDRLSLAISFSSCTSCCFSALKISPELGIGWPTVLALRAREQSGLQAQGCGAERSGIICDKATRVGGVADRGSWLEPADRPAALRVGTLPLL